jgi:hypothetical protein
VTWFMFMGEPSRRHEVCNTEIWILVPPLNWKFTKWNGAFKSLVSTELKGHKYVCTRILPPHSNKACTYRVWCPDTTKQQCNGVQGVHHRTVMLVRCIPMLRRHEAFTVIQSKFE